MSRRIMGKASFAELQDATGRIQKAGLAYAQLSGHFLSSRPSDVRVKIQTTATLVDGTMLNCGQLWTELAPYIAVNMEAVHMRWLKKTTGLPWLAEIHDPMVMRINDDDDGVIMLKSRDRDERLRYWLEKKICKHACITLKYSP
jgi:hypothetical protein